MRFPRLREPAIRYAREGFVVDSFRSASIDGSKRRLARFETSNRIFLPNGAAPPVGSTFLQPELARTLQAISDSGPVVFYQGWIADSIVAEMNRGGGIISRADLATYQPVWRDPITITYRGRTIYSMAPSSSGGVTMAELLNILEGFSPLPPFPSGDHGPPLIESMRPAFM